MYNRKRDNRKKGNKKVPTNGAKILQPTHGNHMTWIQEYRNLVEVQYII